MRPQHAEPLTEVVRAECMRRRGAARTEWIEALAAAYEGAKRAAERGGAVREAGTWYTPVALVDRMLHEAMPARPTRGFRAVDPACGTGNFLVAMARRLRAAGMTPAAVARAVHGMDLDPVAAAIARVRLEVVAGGGGAAAWRTAIRAGDALAAGAWQGAGTFDLVIGNPPFLGQLWAATARGEAARRALRARFAGTVTRYADQAAAFLLLGTELAHARGTVAMVQPVSVLAAGDAAPVRTACVRGGALAAVLFPPAGTFGAAVHTCVPVLRRGRRPGTVRACAADGTMHRLPAIRGAAWSAALAAVRGVPDPGSLRTCGTIGDHAHATADFRQHYYGLRGRVREARGGRTRAGEHRVVTVGAIDAAGCAWGRTPVRLHGRSFTAPVVATKDLAADAVLGPWLRARRGPKVLVATQTRALEAWVDAEGASLPSTPVITVKPRRPDDLWRVAAALLAPSTAALAWQRHGGAALSPGALRVSARQLLELPAPGDARAWTRGAAALRAWQRAPGRMDAAGRFATAMCAAYGVQGPARDGLATWWIDAIARPERRAGGGSR